MDVDLKPAEHPTMMDCYLELNPATVCRVCLERSQSPKKMYNIFEGSQPPHFCYMIMACAAVQIMEGDGLPSVICNKCVAKLNIAWQFKQQCESSDAKLRRYFVNSAQLPLTPDFEGFNMCIKDEQQVFTLPQEQIPVVVPPPVEPVNDAKANVVEDPKPAKKKKKSTFGKQDKNKEIKQHQCDTCGKTFNRREYLTQHIRIHTGEKPYHCHLCEKRFINSGHLTTHMRTHTGERPHICMQCPKAFSTRQELNKHTMVHSGERPFVCKLCGKRFGSSSNLYSHLKHHTGEKNFTCEHCGKAFYTKQELKQHFVVHTGEKAFLCEYCNKRFSQIAHLRRHSKLHK